MSGLSRRSVLGAAAAIPVAALNVPSFAAGLPDAGPTVIELAERALQTWGNLDATCSTVSRAEECLSKWEARNPKPKMREAIDDDADLLAAAKEWEITVAAWGRRLDIAEKQSGYTQADEEQAGAIDENQKAIDALTEKQANTLEEIYAKARVSRIMDDFDLRASIIWDLGLMAGVDLENERAVAVALWSEPQVEERAKAPSV